MSETNSGATQAAASSVATVEAVAKSEASKVESFFEANPKAIAIGFAIAGALIAVVVLHFFF
jgi:mannose/fructose/N-acetylgalactosamine-specific phosphotransferase system component IIC